MDMCHRLSARVRLATFEERLLQQTLEELEEAVSKINRCFDFCDLLVICLFCCKKKFRPNEEKQTFLHEYIFTTDSFQVNSYSAD